mmetsp:Transcript_123147/g.394387  ORF Transcript_123147/g.394387 Transcript_123147/m.394387 type:complete len:601 (+) Transcript_123147:1176-2978(+)
MASAACGGIDCWMTSKSRRWHASSACISVKPGIWTCTSPSIPATSSSIAAGTAAGDAAACAANAAATSITDNLRFGTLATGDALWRFGVDGSEPGGVSGAQAAASAQVASRGGPAAAAAAAAAEGAAPTKRARPAANSGAAPETTSSTMACMALATCCGKAAWTMSKALRCRSTSACNCARPGTSTCSGSGDPGTWMLIVARGNVGNIDAPAAAADDASEATDEGLIPGAPPAADVGGAAAAAAAATSAAASFGSEACTISSNCWWHSSCAWRSASPGTSTDTGPSTPGTMTCTATSCHSSWAVPAVPARDPAVDAAAAEAAEASGNHAAKASPATVAATIAPSPSSHTAAPAPAPAAAADAHARPASLPPRERSKPSTAVSRLSQRWSAAATDADTAAVALDGPWPVLAVRPSRCAAAPDADTAAVALEGPCTDATSAISTAAGDATSSSTPAPAAALVCLGWAPAPAAEAAPAELGASLLGRLDLLGRLEVSDRLPPLASTTAPPGEPPSKPVASATSPAAAALEAAVSKLAPPSPLAEEAEATRAASEAAAGAEAESREGSAAARCSLMRRGISASSAEMRESRPASEVGAMAEPLC